MPTKLNSQEFLNCQNQNELNLDNNNGLIVGDEVYGIFLNKKKLGTVEFIIKDPHGSSKMFIGGTFATLPTDDPHYLIFQFDNKFFIESDKVDIKKSTNQQTVKLIKNDNNRVY